MLLNGHGVSVFVMDGFQIVMRHNVKQASAIYAVIDRQLRTHGQNVLRNARTHRFLNTFPSGNVHLTADRRRDLGKVLVHNVHLFLGGEKELTHDLILLDVEIAIFKAEAISRAIAIVHNGLVLTHEKQGAIAKQTFHHGVRLEEVGVECFAVQGFRRNRRTVQREGVSTIESRRCVEFQVFGRGVLGSQPVNRTALGVVTLQDASRIHISRTKARPFLLISGRVFDGGDHAVYLVGSAPGRGNFIFVMLNRQCSSLLT